MSGKKPIGLALLVAAAAMMVMAFAASSASATEVTPANKKIKATLVSGTFSKLLPKNAYSTTYVSCTAAEAEFTTPTSEGQPGGMSANKNSGEPKQEKGGVGTFSQGQGSVNMQVQENLPKFTGCSLRELDPAKPHEFPGKEIQPATVSTVKSGFQLAGWGLNKTEAMVALGVPGESITIALSGTECVITIGTTASETNVIMGEFNNGTHRARFDSQIKFKDNGKCGTILSPGQYEGEFNTEVVGQPTESFSILPTS
jgi:LysM repeat protein